MPIEDQDDPGKQTHVGVNTKIYKMPCLSRNPGSLLLVVAPSLHCIHRRDRGAMRGASRPLSRAARFGVSWCSHNVSPAILILRNSPISSGEPEPQPHPSCDPKRSQFEPYAIPGSLLLAVSESQLQFIRIGSLRSLCMMVSKSVS
jgi:hypothetical protein